jgi:hypothetical protein
MEIDQKIEYLEKEIQEIKTERKDFWDILKVIGGLLVPAAIAFAGWQYSIAMKNAEIESATSIAKLQSDSADKIAQLQRDSADKIVQLQLEFSREKADFDYKISETNSRVSQAGLVSSFLEPLLSKDETKKKIAIEAVLIALPSEGPRLVKVIKETDTQGDVKKFAQDSLRNYREKLIVQFFSDEKSIRSDAYSRLQSSYQNDSSIIPELIEVGRQNPDNENAVYNALVFFSHMNKETLKPYVKEIEEYSIEVEGNGPKTKARAEKLRSRLPSS